MLRLAVLLSGLLLIEGCYATRAKPHQGRAAHQTALVSEASLAGMEAAIVAATNRFRSEHGLPPLREDRELSRFARSRSQDMATRHYFSHTEPGGKSVFELMTGAGITFSYGAENIHMSRGIATTKVAETAMTGWINSPGHRKNMLAKQPTQIGVGVVQAANGAYYSTQVFSRP